MARGIRETGRPPDGGPHIGMRFWLAAAFAAVGVITAASVYLFVSDASERVLDERATELALGRTVSLADQVARADDPGAVVSGAKGEGFQAWYFGSGGRLVAPVPGGPALEAIHSRREAIELALNGGRYIHGLRGGEVTIVTAPVFGEDRVVGAVLGRYSRAEVLSGAIDRIADETLRALAIAVVIGILAGALVATAIAHRVKRLARSAEKMAAGRFDVPLEVSGRDEIGDLARSLDSMRAALRESFGVLTSDRDKLAAIFDGLTDAVMVVDKEGHVRFSNRAAAHLINEENEPPEPMLPHLRRAASAGFAAHPALRVGDRAFALQVRDLPAERAVLAVARDRTDEMRREWAERDFVSNAAHELRNPLAGISGAIEVLQDGAKEDPEARDHFLEQLARDAERMSRLTQSLLTLARVEALGPAEAEIVDVEVAVRDVVAAVEVPLGIKLSVVVEPDLAAKGDPTLLRQVLIGLVTNALKNTPAPGAVTVRGRHVGEDGVLMEVIDTGTGIPAAELERVFERFYRRSETRKQEGFGLGLAIARRMVSVMGGEIGARSVEGEGSTFWVRLPIVQSTPTPVA
jgi:signal transduction histidine kinase